MVVIGQRLVLRFLTGLAVRLLHPPLGAVMAVDRNWSPFWKDWAFRSIYHCFRFVVDHSPSFNTIEQ